MIAAIHDEFNARCYLAEFPDYKPVAGKLEVIPDVPGKVLNVLKIIVIRIVANADILQINNIVQEAKSLDAAKRKRRCWVRTGHERVSGSIGVVEYVTN